MSDKTGIAWTDATWNPVVGCSVLSLGCTNCYAMAMAERIIRCSEGAGRSTHYEGTVKTSKAGPVWTGTAALAPDSTLIQPLRWRRGRRIFVNSMGDLFHEAVPDEWIDRVFAVMALVPHHTFQVLTKRSARMREYLAALSAEPAERLAQAVTDMGYEV
jgi:protein gp37